MRKPIYVGTGNHETLRILWTGFQDGMAYVRSHPRVMPYPDPDYIVDAAQRACERILESVEPLDKGVFHPVYTHGWMAGYVAAHHDREGTANGLSLFAPAAMTEQDIPQGMAHDVH